MSPVLAAILAMTAPPSEGIRDAAAPPAASVEQTADPAEKAEARSPRKGAELRQSVRAALRDWAKPSDAQVDAAAREFLVLYQELQADDQLSRPQRQYFLGKVRLRLMHLRDQITLRIAREKRLAEARQRDAENAPDEKAGSMARDSGAASDDGLAMGPSGPAFGGGAFQTPDHGQELVDLIQTVIRPETWDVNGGQGTIYYWYPGRALVIRQTDEVHEQIGGVLGQLRRAGP
jgi:hypothetical protein